MIKIIKLVFLTLLLLGSNMTLANSLNQQIEAFFWQQLADVADSVIISHIQQPMPLSCDTPIFSLLNKNKKWGQNVTIRAQCGNKITFLRVNVAVTGNYLVASQPITAGFAITDANTRLQSGRLDTLTHALIHDKDSIIDYIALRNIASEHPITRNMIRKKWQIKAGQTVNVIIKGDSFQVSSQGKALNNAALGEQIKVRINPHKIVEGIVTHQGVIIATKNN